jgi:integrase/recombinase XerD
MPKQGPDAPFSGPEHVELRGQMRKTQSCSGPADLAEIVDQTVRLWRKHHLTYDQTKYVVEQARRRLELSPPRQRKRTVERLDWSEVQALIQAVYGVRSSYGLLVKTLFYTGARVEEFSHIRVADLHLEDDPPQLHLTYAKRQSTRYVPIPPSLADELRTHLGRRKVGFLFESNRHTRYAARTIQSIVKLAALAAGITKRVYPHLLRHSIATLLLQSGEVPLDQVQKFLGHRQIGTTQVYAETSLRALGENYQRAVGDLPGGRR